VGLQFAPYRDAMALRTETDFVLDEQLCFALHSASRAMTNAYRDGLRELGLTYTQYAVLLLLWEHRSLPMGRLAERLHLDSATLTPLLKRMAGQRLVVRERSPDDERVVVVTCTPAGHALRERARVVQARVERATGLDGRELAALRADLHLLAARLRAHTSSDRPPSG
jgi:MarR family transcriptional regulator, organic hydroperoxide resistance regulator